jgi:hypothetical protein
MDNKLSIGKDEITSISFDLEKNEISIHWSSKRGDGHPCGVTFKAEIVKIHKSETIEKWGNEYIDHNHDRPF